MQNTAKQNYAGLVTLYDTRPGNKVGLFYNSHGARILIRKTKTESLLS